MPPNTNPLHTHAKLKQVRLLFSPRFSRFLHTFLGFRTSSTVTHKVYSELRGRIHKAKFLLSRPHHLTLPIVVMAVAMVHFLPQAPHMLWQTAASPFIIPNSWQQMYKRCPRCGGNAPNVCDEVWPENWWEDDMLGLMYQGHIPPARRISPWDAYYSSYRVQYPPPATPQTPLRVDTHYPYYPQEAHMAVQAPMTPPQTPGVLTQLPYSTTTRPLTPTSPTLRYSRQGTFNSVPSFDSVYGPTSQVIDFGTFRY
jgi:hypothetical protein